VLTSTVFFGNAHLAGDLTPAAEACRRHGAVLVLDTYHQLNVVPFSLADRGLLDAYVVSAGYKYCQLGEGNAFLRFPADCDLRPVATGWFAEFGRLAAPQGGDPVGYTSQEDRFGGATYDPTSHYRGAAVFGFFSDQALTPRLLRRVSQAQVELLWNEIDALDLDPGVLDRDREVDLAGIGGFVALHSPHAGRLCRKLKERGVWTDHRDRVLRLGPAPYLSRRQLLEAVGHLGDIARALPGGA
jgi:kynureninase